MSIKNADRSIRVLEDVNRIAKRQATRNMVVRVVFNIADQGQIKRSRWMIDTAVSKFQVYILNFALSLILISLLDPFPYKDE